MTTKFLQNTPKILLKMDQILKSKGTRRFAPSQIYGKYGPNRLLLAV